MSRRGAKKGDIVCVTGTLGRAGAGLFVLGKNRKDDKEAIKRIVEIFPRVHEGRALGALGYVTSSMDISDGVASCLYQLQKINGVGFKVYEEKIPLSGYAKKISGGNGAWERNWAIYSGGDYELLCTVKREKVSMVQECVKAVGGILSPIGEVISKQDILLVGEKGETIIEERGFEHFINK
jgi:thiamine-monophosphate kinase